MHSSYVVITSIQAPTSAVLSFRRALENRGDSLILVADRKTPLTSWYDFSGFLSMEAQRESAGNLAQLLPENHYARKNLGYLQAVRQGAESIFDTDDDNAPSPWWAPRPIEINVRKVTCTPWANVYPYFGLADAWPRGLPLELVRRASKLSVADRPGCIIAPIQQGLADGSPDVDAVWRLLFDREVAFARADPIALSPGSWCPFNSQSTWWFPEAFALMYLPSHVSFRMTDIWRSFVAQRCLWAMGRELVFTGPEVFQDRNEHNLLRDFEQEIPGYLGNERIRRLLEDLDLETGATGAARNLMRCYEALVAAGFVPDAELRLVGAWLADFESAALAGVRSGT